MKFKMTEQPKSVKLRKAKIKAPQKPRKGGSKMPKFS